ncbi:PDZ domain-containing protein [Hydrogenimonas sp.]
MKRLFERLLPLLVWLALAAVGARLAAVAVEFFLPPLPALECRGETPRSRADYPFAKAFGLEAPALSRPSKKPASRPRKVVSLSGYQLTMTAVGEPSMAIVVKGSKSKLLSVGESVDGFRLEEVYTDRVKFVKQGTEYWLSMKKKKGLAPAPTRTRRTKKSANYAEQIRQEGDTYYIPRELLEEFRDVKKIFKYIAIKPIYRNNKLVGFGVSKIKRGSVFAKMGLRKRDIIQKINGEELTSETQAFKYFNQINELSSLTMTIKRGSEEKELHYEIF